MSDLTQEMTLNVISIFDNYQIELAEKGHLILSTNESIKEKSPNSLRIGTFFLY